MAKTTEKDPEEPCGGRRRLADKGIAFSTGQAARYCYVTADTILKWINNGSLKSQRTAGGQHRILVGDLYAFMQLFEMSTELLETELDIHPYCWEFNCRKAGALGCAECVVQRSGAPRCFELRDLRPPTTARPERCEDCDYYRRHGRESAQKG